MTKLKTTEIPSRAKHLYIQLYCEKRGGKTFENLHDAAQSWLSLSLIKKKSFYKTISTKTAVKKAQLIIHTEPYLIAKSPSKVRKQKQKSHECDEQQNNGETASDCTDTDNGITSMHDDTIMECDSNSYAEDDATVPVTSQLETESITKSCVLEQAQNEPDVSNVQNLLKSLESVIDKDTDTADEHVDERIPEVTPLIEPVLPIAKTGKELFYLLMERKGDKTPYEFLSKKEKAAYGRAVTAIKKEYVKNYKEYLQSLTSRQLFDYYRKIF